MHDPGGAVGTRQRHVTVGGGGGHRHVAVGDDHQAITGVGDGGEIRGTLRAGVTHGPGEPVGEMQFFAGGLRTADVIVLQESELLKVPSALVNQLAEDFPLFFERLVQIVRQAGLQVEAARYADSLGFLAALVYRFAGDDSGVISPRSVRVYDRFLFPLSRRVDHLTLGSFGKNVLVVASKPEPA